MFNDLINKSGKTLAVLCLLNNVNPFVRADQPVHCLKENLLGSWDFHVSEEATDVDVFHTSEICTHERPNHVQVVNRKHGFSFAKESVWNLQLNDNYKASASKGEQILAGTWSTVYDQAIRVELEDGTRFVSNLRYNVKPAISGDPLADGGAAFEGIGTGDYKDFDSDCTRTMVGFVQKKGGDGSTMKKHHAQCFHGVQKKHEDIYKSRETENGDGAKFANYVNAAGAAAAAAQTSADSSSIEDQGEVQISADSLDSAPSDDTNLQIKSELRSKAKSFMRQSHKRFNAHKAHKPSDENDMLIQLINELDLGWKADTCKYQKHHSNYGDHCEALHLAQTSAATETDDAEVFGEGEKFKTAYAQVQELQKKYSSADKIPDEELPANFDWRNINGVDFTSKHRDQGHCGSCYTVSFTQIVEQRLRLKYGKDMPLLSPQYLMTCNYMNEGCDGGWPFFHGFLAENGHLVTDECAPYIGKTKGDKCSNYEACEPHSKVSDSYFIGKGYGDSTEQGMMKEIMRNGIVNGELNAPHIFHMYTKGVLTQQGIKKLNKTLLAQVSSSKEAEKPKAGDKKEEPEVKKHMAVEQGVTAKNLADYGLEWQNLNHSVVIVGWGTDPINNQKYWIVRNSYGANWGDHGDFMVQRGTDDFGIESETTAYEPLLCGGEGGAKCA